MGVGERGNEDEEGAKMSVCSYIPLPAFARRVSVLFFRAESAAMHGELEMLRASEVSLTLSVIHI